MWVGVTASMLVILLIGLAIVPKPHTPILFDLGAALMAIGMLAVAESVFTGQPCSGKAIAFRWIFNTSGLVLILLAYVRALRK